MEYILVDGYNIINSWADIFQIDDEPLEDMRDQLIGMLADYQGYKGCEMILVFDAHHVKGNPGTELQYGRLKVIYTKENYSADSYIERFVHLNAKDDIVRVVTGDYLEQRLVLYGGGLRISPKEFLNDIRNTKLESKEYIMNRNGNVRKKNFNNIFSNVDEKTLEILEELRMADF